MHPWKKLSNNLLLRYWASVQCRRRNTLSVRTAFTTVYGCRVSGELRPKNTLAKVAPTSIPSAIIGLPRFWPIIHCYCPSTSIFATGCKRNWKSREISRLLLCKHSIAPYEAACQVILITPETLLSSNVINNANNDNWLLVESHLTYL